MTGQALPGRRSLSLRRLPLLALLLILGASLVPRLPILWNADISFNSDEAANALVIKHMLEGKGFTLYNWGVHYHGIVEGLLAIPFTGLFGFTPLAFKLAAVTGFLLLVAATYLLGRRLYGPAQGLAAAALLVVFSPHLVMWSTLASVGYLLVAGWGSLTVAHLAATRQRPTPEIPGRIVALGLLVGFGLYIYEVYLIYVVLLAGFALTASFLWQALLAPSPQELSAALRLAPRQLRTAALFAAGFLVGWAPKLWMVLFGGDATKVPSYGLAGPDQIWENLKLLVTRCVPALFGINPTGDKTLKEWVGPAGAALSLLGLLAVLVYLAAWVRGAARAGPEIAGVLARPPRTPLGMESLLVLLVPLTALLFVLSPNPEGVLSSRFLIPWLTSLPLLAGSWLVALWRRHRAVAAAMALLLVGHPAAQTVRWQVERGYLTADLRLPRLQDPLRDVLRYLREQGVRGGYGWYWIAYEATFWSDEEIVIAPLAGWDRYPPYSRFVDRLPNPAYLFELHQKSEQQSRREFVARLRELGRPYQERQIGGYAVFTSPQGRRLLPLSVQRGMQRLAAPRARIEIRDMPAVAAPGQTLALPARLTNTGTELWPAVAAGPMRVTFSYRWLTESGEPVELNGLRTFLPDDVPPGAAVDVVARVRTPGAPGRYQLVFSLVQEDVAWFLDIGGGAEVFHLTIESDWR